MINYEIVFIVDPTLDDEMKEKTVETVKEIISTAGEVKNTEIWGLRKLEYPIEKKTEGYYAVIDFQAEPTLPKELDRRLRISDNVIRHLIVNKDEK